MNVIKTQTVEYDTISAGDTPWSDPNFPTSDALYWADHESETEFVQYLPDNITWSRVSARQYGIQSLWGPGGEAAINPTDLNQGGVGNCWIISAISAIAEVPGRVTNLMLNDEISEAGIYGVNMYALGVPYTEYVDGLLPIAEDWETGEMGHLFAGLWFALARMDLSGVPSLRRLMPRSMVTTSIPKEAGWPLASPT